MTEAEIDEFMDDALAEIGRNPHRCKEGASRGSFALSCLLKVCLSPLRLLFVAVARDVGMSAMGHLLT